MSRSLRGRVSFCASPVTERRSREKPETLTPEGPNPGTPTAPKHLSRPHSAAAHQPPPTPRRPPAELMPVAAAYGRALDSYAAGNWTEAIQYLEESLRSCRLRKEGARHCALRCSKSDHHEPSAAESNQDLRAHWRVLTRARCQRECRAQFPALQLPPPATNVLEEFTRRSPYRYLHFAYARLHDLQRAVPCAHTFLQKNPRDQEMLQVMEAYTREYDVSGFLTDYEERPYEASFLKGVKLIVSGDYAGGVEPLEDALRLYVHEHELCQADCEAVARVSTGEELYTLLAGVYVDVLRCKLRCEENLKPNVGGYFVEKFVATVYHYLQFAYYKLNDGRRAAPCARSHALFEPEDQVMKQNLLYYEAYGAEWGLRPEHFAPRTEALRHHNQIVAQRQMLAFAEQNLRLDGEGPEAESPDAEFEGLGDYEEWIYADWRQEKGKGDAGEWDA